MRRVPELNLDGHVIGEVELALAPPRQLLIDGQLAVMVHIIGSMVALIVDERWVCVRTTDYMAVLHASPADEQPPKSHEAPDV